ncbi:hypothetical protein MPER_16415, partial [Moniliophthora perniciosa FA553]
NNDPRYTEAWTPFMTRINEITAAHQITNGGSIASIFPNSDGSLNFPVADYMVRLEQNARDNGVLI